MDRIIDDLAALVIEMEQHVANGAVVDEGQFLRLIDQAHTIGRAAGRLNIADAEQDHVEFFGHVEHGVQPAALDEGNAGFLAVDQSRGGDQVAFALKNLRKLPGEFRRI